VARIALRAMALPGLALALAAVAPTPALAEVFQKADNGFIIRNGAVVTAAPDVAWRTIINPADWWSADHTYSGDSANLSLDPAVQGCFCELLPSAQSRNAAPRGHVEHMRVIFVDHGRTLRLSGALGPLQSEAVTGTLTINLKPVEGEGTRILWEYVVGGYMRFRTEEIAPAVDRVLSEQMARLAGRLGVSKGEAPPEEAIPAASAPPVDPKADQIGR